MGDVCDMNDLQRFMSSPEGAAHLESIRQALKGRTIVEVDFSNEVYYVAVILQLDDDSVFAVSDPSLEVGTLRLKFEEVLDREYYVEFPERKP